MAFEGSNNICKWCGESKESHIPEGYDEWEYQPCEQQKQNLEALRNKEHIAWCKENNFCGMPWKYFHKKIEHIKLNASSEIEKKHNEQVKKVISLYCENIEEMYIGNDDIYICGGCQEDRTIILCSIAHAAAKSCLKKNVSRGTEQILDYIDISYMFFDKLVEAAYENVRGKREKHWDPEVDPDHNEVYLEDAIKPDVLLIDGFDISLFYNRENMIKNTISRVLTRRLEEQKLTIISGISTHADATNAFAVSLGQYEQIIIIGGEEKKPIKLAKKLIDITKAKASNV